MIEMMYNSTRGQDLHKTSAQAIQQGLAADGGLFMPAELPSFTEDEIRSLCSRPASSSKYPAPFLISLSFT